jgi:hypothetical protein
MKQIFLMLLIGSLLSCRPNGNYLAINNNDLYFTPAVDKEFIGKVSEYLVSTEFFAQGGKSVQLDVVNSMPVFRLVIKASVAKDSSTKETAVAFGRIFYICATSISIHCAHLNLINLDYPHFRKFQYQLFFTKLIE